MLSRRQFLLSGLAGPLLTARARAAVEAAGPQPIEKIETFIIRDPPVRDKPESYFVSMPPVGQMNNRKGMSSRIDRAETVRQGGYRQTLLVKITTKDGIHGWGEGHAVMTPRVVKTVISDMFVPILLGEDARNVEVLWEKMYSTQRLRGYSTGYFTRAAAGIDIALWDILGKIAGLSVSRLLGGNYRTTIPTYQGVGGDDVSSTRENAQELLDLGYSVMKMGFSKGRGAQASNFNRVIAASEAIGDKGELLIDSLGAYKLHEATKVGRDIDALGNIGWWEDVLIPEDMDGYARLADAIDTPVCAGEQYSNQFQFRDLFAKRAVDIINPDIARIGLTASKRIAVMADIHNVLLSPHCSMGTAPYRAASIHLCACSPNSVILEGGETYKQNFGNALLRKPLNYKGGSVETPQDPGLGVDFDEDALKEFIVG